MVHVSWRIYFFTVWILFLGSVSVKAQVPSTITNGLRAGGVNLVFGYYDPYGYKPTEFDDDLPVIRSKGAGHVRLAISMDIIENGKTGQLRLDRFQDLKNFVNRAKANGLVTIIDIHNSGIHALGTTNGEWTHDYMGNLRDAGVRSRHISLLSQLAKAAATELDRNWFVLQPANEPIFTNGDHAIWYNHQNQLVPAIRQNCADCTIFVMAHTWQAISATIYNLEPRTISWFDSRMIVDMHFYNPLGLTHCAFTGNDPTPCQGKQWPGYYEDYLPSGAHYKGQWDKSLLERELKVLWDWRARNNNVPVHFSEIGTHSFLADGPRAAYINDVTSIFRDNGVGWSCWEWDKNFGIINHPKTIQACFKGGTTSSPTPTPSPTSTPSSTSTPTPTAAPSPTPTATASPTPTPTGAIVSRGPIQLSRTTVSPGETIAISSLLTIAAGTPAFHSIIKVSNGSGTVLGETVKSSIVASANGTYLMQGSFIVPSGMPNQTLYVDIGAWSSDWRQTYMWHAKAGQFQVGQNISPTPTPTPAMTPTPAPVTSPTPILTPTPSPTPSQPGALPAKAALVAQHSKLCLDVWAASKANAANILQWSCHYKSNQVFQLKVVSGGHQIIASHSGKCLTVNSTANGAVVQQHSCGTHASQTFVFHRQADGSYELRSALSGKCLDLKGATLTNGDPLIQFSCHGGQNQRFKLEAR